MPCIEGSDFTLVVSGQIESVLFFIALSQIGSLPLSLYEARSLNVELKVTALPNPHLAKHGL